MRERESVWSVAARWVPWCLALIFVITIGWTAFVAWTLSKHDSHASASLLAVETVGKSGPAVPLILLVAVCLVSLVDSLEGLIVVTKRYLDSKLVEPVRRQLREEGREEGRKEGLKEGLKEGREEGREEGEAIGEKRANRRWEAWNRRRLEAEDKGELFSEPPPDSSTDNGNG